MTDIFQKPIHMSTVTATAASFNNDTTNKQVHPDYAKANTTDSNNTKNETDSAVSQLLARLDEVSRLLFPSLFVVAYFSTNQNQRARKPLPIFGPSWPWKQLN